MAIITVTLDKPSNREEFIKKMQETDEIEECYHIVGEADYLLKARCKNIETLEKLISVTIKEIAGIVKTSTTVVLSSVKEKKSFFSTKSKK